MKRTAQKIRRLLGAAASLFALAAACPASAQTVNIFGKVEDDFLGVGLPAHVSIHNPDSTVVIDSATVVPFYSSDKILWVSYYAAVPAEKRDYLVRARLEGYGDVWQSVSVTDPKAKEVEVPMLKMRRMRTVDLEGFTVTATKIKMFYKGDTLVYNADAFNLPEGSMLDDLIRQLDGVTMNEAGEIFVNGKKIDELLLGSRSFMRGNSKVLMQNLPYYTVKHIKVYDKLSERDEALGTRNDPKRYVMDVNLKKEYQNGYMGNAELAAGTENRWLGRGFVLGFTEGLRYSLMANANNVNESRHIGKSGHWTPSVSREMTTIRSVKADIDYESSDKKVEDLFFADYNSTASYGEMRQRRETFVTGHTPWSIQQRLTDNDSRSLSLINRLKLTRSGYTTVQTIFKYAKIKGSSSSTFDQYDDSLTTAQRTVGMNEGKNIEAQALFSKSFAAKNKKSTFDMRVEINYLKDESQRAERFVTDSRVASTSETLHNSTDYSNSRRSAALRLNYSKNGHNEKKFKVDNTLSVEEEKRHDWLYHPDTLTLASRLQALQAITDPSNSFDSRLLNISNTLKLSFVDWYIWEFMPGFTTGFPMLDVGLNLPLQIQSLDYRRGTLDTLARQSRLFVDPYINYHHPLFKGDIELSASLSSSLPQLTDRISYSDTRSPLVVLLGNPGLKPRMSTHLKIHYNGNFHKMSISNNKPNPNQWHVGALGDFSHRDVAQSTVYDPATGVYTYQPMNVSGGYHLCGYGGVDRGIGEKRYWTWHTGIDADYRHSVDHTMLAGETESRRNAVNTFTLHDNLYLQFSKGDFNIRATGDVNWRQSKGRMRDFEKLNVTDFRYGLNARYTLPVVNTTVSADANMYSRRGYGSSQLNTDDFVVNASVSQPFLKGKLIARVEAFDLLHQLSSTQYEVNAQGRTETWYRSLPHYVMAHVVYHWNKNPKKK